MASSSDEQPKPPEPPAAAVVAAPPQTHAEWAASLQAYYAAAGHPYAWPAQHLMAAAAAGAPFGTPVPFPVYHPGAAAAYYAHASMAAGVPYPTSEAVATVAAATAPEGKGKGKGGGASPEKGSSGAPSGEDDSRSDSGSDESSETRDDDTDHKGSSAPKKRKSGNTSAEGEPSQAAVVRYAAVESPYPAKGRSASKLPVSAPGRAALPSATPNLNIGMDIWNASPALAVPAVQGEANPGLALARRDGVTQLDERELKRERRKQSNRESARRSRLRKQQECEELARKVADLTTENSALRAELDNLRKACQDMEAENSRLLVSTVPSVTTTLGMSIEPPKAQQHHDDEGQLHKKSSNNSNGKGSHKPEANTR